MPRILSIFGTRPEAIKMLPVVRELRRRGLDQRVCVTGQHRELLGQVFEAFGERPDQDLALMQPGQTPAEVTARVLERLGPALAEARPALVLVHGDTTTAMAAALAAFLARVPVGHVEAGLRSHDLTRPWPEEFNRVSIDATAALRFAPTQGAADNLAREYGTGRVVVTGNTGIDALLHVSAGLGPPPPAGARRLVLVTGHRRESFGEGFRRLCDGLAAVASRGDVELLYPVHPNPEVRRPVHERLGNLPNVRLCDPVGYVEMVGLLRAATLVITDSGGIQEEAPALGRPVLVTREVTERPEAVALGAVRLVGTCPATLKREADLLLDDAAEYARRSVPVFPYGDGRAAARIADAIEEFLAP
jgi:UDP-N-acetylglucosamine 2-epimerase (non-hydrolysing)